MIVNFLAQLPAILLAISVHEFGHGFVAYLLGDDTAKNEGRLTIDPIKHIDLFGFLVMMIAHFGWAKPVPINENNFKNKRLGIILVSLAGPIFNLILAVVSIYIFKAEKYFIDIYALNIILKNMIEFNMLFAAFNLIPIPPLDGSKILFGMLPANMYQNYWKYENVGSIILLLLIMTDKIGLVIYPIYNIISNLMVIFI